MAVFSERWETNEVSLVTAPGYCLERASRIWSRKGKRNQGNPSCLPELRRQNWGYWEVNVPSPWSLHGLHGRIHENRGLWAGCGGYLIHSQLSNHQNLHVRKLCKAGKRTIHEDKRP